MYLITLVKIEEIISFIQLNIDMYMILNLQPLELLKIIIEQLLMSISVSNPHSMD